MNERPAGMSQTRPAARICGVDVNSFDSVDSCADLILRDIATGRGGFAVALNAEKAVTVRENRAVRSLIQQGTLVYPDGAGVVLAMRRAGAVTARVPGVELWLAVLRRAKAPRLRIALIGSKPEVLLETARRIGIDYSSVYVVLALDGYAGASDLDSVAINLLDARPHLILVAMGSPRQEEAIVRLRSHYPTGYFLGLGGSFDVYTGAKKRAPRWMQRYGLEWLYRFISEPSRGRREIVRLRFLQLLLTGRT